MNRLFVVVVCFLVVCFLRVLFVCLCVDVFPFFVYFPLFVCLFVLFVVLVGCSCFLSFTCCVCAWLRLVVWLVACLCCRVWCFLLLLTLLVFCVCLFV